MMNIKKHYWWLAPVLISGVIYFNSLGGKFFWDDWNIIIENPLVKNWSTVLKTFSPDYWLNVHAKAGGLTGQYRPLRNITFTLDYTFWRTNPFGYHLTNYLLNLITVFLVAFVARKIFSCDRIAMLSGILFSVHPAHIENINYIKNRSDLLCLLFILLTLYLFITRRHFLGILTYILAVLSKEFAVMLPVFFVFYMYLNSKLQKKQEWLKILPYLLISGLFILGQLLILKSDAQPQLVDPDISGTNPILLVISTIINYISLMFLPVSLKVDRRIEVFGSIFNWQVFFFVLAVIVVMYFVHKSKDRAKYWLSIFWILTFLLPVSNIIPITGRAFAEQRLYIPSFGGVLFLGLVLNNLLDKEKSKKLTMALIAAIVLFLGTKIIMRNHLWTDEILLWQHALKQDNRNLRAMNNLAASLFRRGYYQEAEKIYKEIIKFWQTNDGAWTNLGIISQMRGETDKAIEYFNKVLELSPHDYRSYANLGSIYLLKGDKQKAREFYEQALKFNQNIAGLYANLGIIYVSEKKYKEAAALFRKAVELNPDIIEARLNLASVYKKMGLEYESQQELREAETRQKTMPQSSSYNPMVVIK